MAFKGNEKHSADDVNRIFDELGARYNASTSEETTMYYAAVLPEYLPDRLRSPGRPDPPVAPRRRLRGRAEGDSRRDRHVRGSAVVHRLRKRDEDAFRRASARAEHPGFERKHRPAHARPDGRLSSRALPRRATSRSPSPATPTGTRSCELANRWCGNWPAGRTPRTTRRGAAQRGKVGHRQRSQHATARDADVSRPRRRRAPCGWRPSCCRSSSATTRAAGSIGTWSIRARRVGRPLVQRIRRQREPISPISVRRPNRPATI